MSAALAIINKAAARLHQRHNLELVWKRPNKTAGTYITDLAERKKSLVFCSGCEHKFNAKKWRYYKQTRFPYVQGNCCGCQAHTDRGALYIHQSLLAEPGGKILHGKVWTPE